MINKLLKTGCGVILMWSMGKFILGTTPISNVTLTSPAAVTAVICAAIIALAIIVPLLLSD